MRKRGFITLLTLARSLPFTASLRAIITETRLYEAVFLLIGKGAYSDDP